jgi:polysaccharide export outer membrane protein
MRLLLGVLWLWFVIAPLCAHGQEYRLGPGDVLSIEVFGEPALTRELRLSAACALDLGLVGPVPACDVTPHGLRDEITRRLADGFLVNPVVIVRVAEYGSHKVEIRGAIKTPGIMVLDGPTTLSQLITKAGGPATENVVEVDLIRESGDHLTFEISKLEQAQPAPLVESGDIVILGFGRHVYVSGEVAQEGPVPFREGLTVTQALSLAGGMSEFASPRRAYVLRATGEKVPFNLKRISEGRDADVPVYPDDRLVVRSGL